MSSTSPVPSEVLARLQTMLLESVLAGRPLPGGQHPLHLPDLPFLLEQPAIWLLDENLAGPVNVPAAPKPVEVVSQEELQRRAQTGGDVPYLRFQPPEVQEGAIRLSLEAKIAQGASQPERRPLGLSGIQARFRQVGDDWELAEDPAAYAF